MRGLLTYLLLTLLTLLALTGAQAQNTMQKRLRGAAAGSTAVAVAADTVCGAAADSLLTFSGYEKTLRATRETIFLTSRADRPLTWVSFEISYCDAQGRVIHRRRVAMHTDVAPGETRRLDFPSWDVQKSFYYRGGARPRVAAVPYTVKISDPKFLTYDD